MSNKEMNVDFFNYNNNTHDGLIDVLESPEEKVLEEWCLDDIFATIYKGSILCEMKLYNNETGPEDFDEFTVPNALNLNLVILCNYYELGVDTGYDYHHDIIPYDNIATCYFHFDKKWSYEKAKEEFIKQFYDNMTSPSGEKITDKLAEKLNSTISWKTLYERSGELIKKFLKKEKLSDLKETINYCYGKLIENIISTCAVTSKTNFFKTKEGKELFADRSKHNLGLGFEDAPVPYCLALLGKNDVAMVYTSAAGLIITRTNNLSEHYYDDEIVNDDALYENVEKYLKEFESTIEDFADKFYVSVNNCL